MVDISTAMPLLEFAHHQRAMLGRAPTHVALPEPVALLEEMVDGDADLTVDAQEVSSRPTEDASPIVEEEVFTATYEKVKAGKYPGALLIEEFLGYMPRSESKSAEATRLLRSASCIKSTEKWFDLAPGAPREVWTAALDVMRKK